MAIKKEFLIEQQISEDITSTVAREVKRIKKMPELSAHEIGALEKYSKIYAMIMASHREDRKAGVFTDMDDKELEKLIE